jgi:hypothetical protein
MSERAAYSTKIDKKLKELLIELSRDTRIPQAKLLDEAIKDLLHKYGVKTNL